MEILIWGDDMKQQISVSIFLAVLVLALSWLYIKLSNETQPEKEIITTENNVLNEQSITISQEYILYPYYIKNMDERLVVYRSENDSIFMETSIEIYLLPEDVLLDLEDGIFFENEEKLYDFLESYSS